MRDSELTALVKKFRRLHLKFLATAFLFHLLLMFLAQRGISPDNAERFYDLYYIAPFLIMVTLLYAIIWFKKKVKSIWDLELEERIEQYKAYFKTQLLLVTAASSIAAIAAYLTKDAWFQIMFFATLFVFVIARPNNLKILIDLNLKETD